MDAGGLAPSASPICSSCATTRPANPNVIAAAVTALSFRFTLHHLSGENEVVLCHREHHHTSNLFDPYHPFARTRQRGQCARRDTDSDQDGGHPQRKNEQVDKPERTAVSPRHPGEDHAKGRSAAGGSH